MGRCVAFGIEVLRVLVVAAFGLFAFVGSSPARVTVRAPLVGADYTHYRYLRCDLNDGGIVVEYDQPGVRRTVRRQLAAMRAAGIQTLRLLLWHITDASGLRWGIVSSDDGHLGEPDRSNLIHFLSDVRTAGYAQLTLVFAPEGNDAPLPPAPGNVWDPTRFEVNWRFIRDVRPLLKRYGPESTQVDLINEGAPPAWESPDVIAQAESYIANMWSNYVTAFGGEDARTRSLHVKDVETRIPRLTVFLTPFRALEREAECLAADRRGPRTPHAPPLKPELPACHDRLEFAGFEPLQQVLATPRSPESSPPHREDELGDALVTSAEKPSREITR
jgi:hypothetical protein